MTDTVHNDEQIDTRVPWITPTIDTIAAGDAEVGFRTHADGPSSGS